MLNVGIHEMNTEKRKNVPSYTCEQPTIPPPIPSPRIVKKKKKFQKTNNQDGTRLLDILPEVDDTNESVNRTQLSVEVPTVEKHNTPGYELEFARTMTNEELNSHIQKCLEMSSENKITPKNAFALQLIDCMKLLLNKKDFSVMACTLDAGQKIYAYRVDGLHQQVIKLAEEVIHNVKGENKNVDGKNGGEENYETLRTEKRKTSKKNILASFDILKRKLRNKDPKDEFIKVDGLPGAIISSVKRDPKDLSFTLENNVPFWQDWEKYEPVKVTGTVTIPQFEIYREKKESTVKENDSIKSLSSQLINMAISTHDSLNMSVGDIQEPLQEESPGDVIMNESDSDDLVNSSGDKPENEDKEEVGVISTALKRLNEEAEVNGETCKSPSRLEAMKIIFNQVSDYHYLNMEKAYYWAGPEFWKRPKTSTTDSKERKKIPRKKKEPSEISYTDQTEEIKLEKLSKKTPVLTRKTIMGWKIKRVTYANDLKIGLGLFLDLFHIPGMNLSEVNNPELSELETTAEAGQDNDSCSQDNCNKSADTSNSQDTLNSCFYEGAPKISSSPEDRDPLNSAFYDVGLAQLPGVENIESGKVIKVLFSNNNSSDTTLVPVPKMVKINPIKYSNKPIRVDMQHLKQTMWGIILENSKENNQEEKEEHLENEGILTGIKFSSVLRQLPERLESRTAQDLFPGMAFLALLTLANEKSLLLKNCEGYSDVVICCEKEES